MNSTANTIAQFVNSATQTLLPVTASLSDALEQSSTRDIGVSTNGYIDGDLRKILARRYMAQNPVEKRIREITLEAVAEMDAARDSPEVLYHPTFTARGSKIFSQSSTVDNQVVEIQSSYRKGLDPGNKKIIGNQEFEPFTLKKAGVPGKPLLNKITISTPVMNDMYSRLTKEDITLRDQKLLQDFKDKLHTEERDAIRNMEKEFAQRMKKSEIVVGRNTPNTPMFNNTQRTPAGTSISTQNDLQRAINTPLPLSRTSSPSTPFNYQYADMSTPEFNQHLQSLHPTSSSRKFDQRRRSVQGRSVHVDLDDQMGQILQQQAQVSVATPDLTTGTPSSSGTFISARGSSSSHVARGMGQMPEVPPRKSMPTGTASKRKRKGVAQPTPEQIKDIQKAARGMGNVFQQIQSSSIGTSSSSAATPVSGDPFYGETDYQLRLRLEKLNPKMSKNLASRWGRKALIENINKNAP